MEVQVFGVKKTERESLLSRSLGGEPGVRDGLERWEKRRDALGRNDLEGRSAPLHVVECPPEPSPAPAVERECRERHVRFFPELEHGEPEVDA